MVETLWLAQSAKLRLAKSAMIVAATLIFALPLFLLIAVLAGLASGSVALPD
ncbi:hypothetical protein D3C71_2214200 [compost metagenome]